MKTDFAKAFRVIRAAYGLQQAELAERIGISASQLSLIENGKRKPSLRVIGELGSAVGIPTSLITLLASDAKDVMASECADLAKALLQLLTSASPQRQSTLPLGHHQ